MKLTAGVLRASIWWQMVTLGGEICSYIRADMTGQGGNPINDVLVL